MTLSIRDVSLAGARELPAIPSGYRTGSIYSLRAAPGPDVTTWSLQRHSLSVPIAVEYDQGRFDDWTETYAYDPGLDRLRFIAAAEGSAAVGLLTWAHAEWNETLWLVDIRVRAASRRTGIGSALLIRLLDHASSTRVRGIHVETQIHNAPAIDFYRSHGFEFSGFNANLYSNSGLEEQDVAAYLFRATDS